MKTNIAIIGGGPGGLTLARLLQLKGADVKVYERDKNRQVRVQGATLDLHAESGLLALEKGGLIEAFKQKYRPGADKMRIMDGQANIVYDQHLEETTEAFGEAHFRPEIDRGPLRDLLLDSLKPGTVVWDSHIVSAKEDAGAWLLQFDNGSSAHADIVIGADGANSKIRKLVTPITPVYSGIMVIEGTVYDATNNAPRLDELTSGGKLFALADDKTLVTSAKEDGSLAFYTAFRKEESWAKTNGLDFTDQKQLLQWFREEYAGWNKIWAELFDNDQTTFIPRPQYHMPLDQTWEPHANITLLGDAAHVMPPYAGEGVNMAMLDALELSECLTDDRYPDTKTAIAAYEQLMRRRAIEIGRMTLEQTDRLHAPGALRYILDVFNGTA